VPAQQRVGPDEQRAPARAREEPAGRRQERSIRWPQLGPPCLATKDLELVARHDDLELLEVLRAKAQQDQREHPPQSEVEKRHQQLRPSL
jgi:hypothetical protein